MKKLTAAEEQIMQIIWEIAPCSVGQIIEHLGEPRPPHSTISSLVRILDKKGFITHEAYGRTYVYRPVLKKSAYLKSSLKELMRNYFSNSPAQLVSFLVSQKEVDRETLLELIDKLQNE